MRLVLVLASLLATQAFAQSDTCATPSAGSETIPMPGGTGSSGGGKRGGKSGGSSGGTGGIVSNRNSGKVQTTTGSTNVQAKGASLRTTSPLMKNSQ
jgi:hypothetical protein